MYNDTVPNQVDYNMPNNGENVLLRSWEDSDHHNSEASTNNTILEQYDCDDVLDATQQEEVNTELEWTLKKYRVDNNNIDDTELDDNASVFRLVIQAILVMSQVLFRSICRATAAVIVILGMENRSVHSESIKSNPL